MTNRRVRIDGRITNLAFIAKESIMWGSRRRSRPKVCGILLWSRDQRFGGRRLSAHGRHRGHEGDCSTQSMMHYLHFGSMGMWQRSAWH